MALIKTKKIKGLDAQYWKLSGWYTDTVDNVVRATFVCFINRAQRLDSIGNWLEQITINLPFDSYAPNKIYNWVKAEQQTVIDIVDGVEVPRTVNGFFYQSTDSQE